MHGSFVDQNSTGLKKLGCYPFLIYQVEILVCNPFESTPNNPNPVKVLNTNLDFSFLRFETVSNPD
jgi:hypothetical protein